MNTATYPTSAQELIRNSEIGRSLHTVWQPQPDDLVLNVNHNGSGVPVTAASVYHAVAGPDKGWNAGWRWCPRLDDLVSEQGLVSQIGGSFLLQELPLPEQTMHWHATLSHEDQHVDAFGDHPITACIKLWTEITAASSEMNA